SKNPLQNFSGELGLSGKEWVQPIQNEAEALEALTDDVTKTVYHVTYSEEKEDEIICTCGKSVKQACPEHVEEWNYKYTRGSKKAGDAVPFLILEYATKFARLETALLEANERIVVLEKKLVTRKGGN
ncbi:MAG: hypothetical protein LBE70_02560, partial [Nitrososphaerota archaeon]|nr:hypothetical protein [Nitrososphaerota archaeon]